MSAMFSADHVTGYLKIWRDVLAGEVLAKRPDLTNRQMAILLIVYLDADPHTVRGLAARLKVAKPVVTRALTALEKRGFVRRKKDERDRRNLFVQRTVKGAVFLSELGDHIADGASHDGAQH